MKRIIDKMKITPIFFLLIFSFVFGSDTTKIKNVIIIPVKGEINAAMSAFIGRAIEEGKKYKDIVFVFEIDTYGGEVDAAFNIVDTILSLTDFRTISYVKTKALSAGALIALSCKEMVMRRNTTIGDVAPLIYSSEGPKILGEKFQSPIRAKFRALAKRNGYPSLLTEAMVTEELCVYQVKFKDTTLYLDSAGLAMLPAEKKKEIISKKIVVRSKELLTMDDVEAKEYGFSKGSVNSFEEMLSLMGLSGAKIIKIDKNWSEKFVSFISLIAPLLIMIGLAGIYIEMRTPGFGAPGIIGIICISLVLFSQYLVGMANYTEILLLLIGILLLAAEIFVLPGFGITGILGIAAIVLALILSFQNFVIPRPQFPWEKQILTKNILYILVSVVGAFGIIVVFLRYILPKIGKIVNGPYLDKTLAEAVVTTPEISFLKEGEKGIAITPLRPSGKAEFNNKLYDVVTDGFYIEKGEKIVIDKINGNTIIVKKDTNG